MKVRISSLFIFSICAFWLTAAVFAGAPARISYQGTLRKSDAVYTGSVPMEFRITDKTGSAVYWTSNSTDVYVSAGLFRYTLGTPNETQFQNVDWKSVTPYLEVIIEGNALPGEPLYSSPYSLYSDSAGGARGDFSVQDGNIAISTTAGNKGIIFQDKTVQYTAVQPVWSVYGANLYVLPAGGAGIGTNSPAARLDVKAGGSGASDMAQIWRNSADIIVSSVSATGVLKAARFVGDGSGLTGVSAGIAGVVSDNAQFSGDGAGTGTMLTLKSSSATLQGNSFNGPGQLVRPGEPGDGVGEIAQLYLRLGLKQNGFGQAFGLGVFFGKLGEGRLRAAIHAIRKRRHRGGVGAIFAPAGGDDLLAAQAEREQNQQPLPQKCHELNLNEAAKRQKREIQKF